MRLSKNFGIVSIATTAITLTTALTVKPEATFAACLSSTCVQNVNINGGNYDLSYLYGSFNDLESILTQQIWWGNQSLATVTAKAVAGDLGFPHWGGTVSPFYAIMENSKEEDIRQIDSRGELPVQFINTSSSGGLGLGNIAQWAPAYFAVADYSSPAPAAAVPEPTTLAGLALAGAGLAAARRKRQTE